MKKFFIPLLIFLTSCQGNMFKDASNKTTAEALYENALKLTDSGDYADAFDQITTIETTYPSFATTDTFKKTKAGIQAGQCGVNFINLIDGLSHATGSAPFLILMQAFQGVAVNEQKCIDAIATMNTMTTVDNDQLLFQAILGMSKVGTYMRDRADRDGTNNLGDGTADATFNACDSTTAANRLDDDDLKQVITGLGLTLQNASQIGGTFAGSSAAGALQTMQAFCDDPLGDGTGSGHDADKIDCSITDPNSASLTPTLLNSFRNMIDSQQYGVGTCDITSTICCP